MVKIQILNLVNFQEFGLLLVFGLFVNYGNYKYKTNDYIIIDKLLKNDFENCHNEVYIDMI